MSTVQQRLTENKIILPPPPGPKANYNLVSKSTDGKTLYLSGHLPALDDGSLMTGRVGEGALDSEYGYKAARQCGLNLIASLKEHLGGDLDRVERVVKVRAERQWTLVFEG